MATGWGQTVHDGTLEGRLHQVPLTIVKNSDCSMMYGLKYNIPITDGHICAGPQLGNVAGTCVVSSYLIINSRDLNAWHSSYGVENL
jgi:hypothetical protein